MSINYYARIKPSQFDKDCLKKLIDNDKYEALSLLYSKVYGSLEYDYADEMFNGGLVHLGKASGGWKFLWNPNWEFKIVDIKAEHWQWEMVSPYTLTKKGIRDFIDREDVEIYDEYDCKQDKEDFWNMALNWCPDGADGDSEKCQFKPDIYDRIISAGIKPTNYHDISIDGLRFSLVTDFC